MRQCLESFFFYFRYIDEHVTHCIKIILAADPTLVNTCGLYGGITPQISRPGEYFRNVKEAVIGKKCVGLLQKSPVYITEPTATCADLFLHAHQLRKI